LGKFVKGDVVIIPFPFTDLSKNKKRPALIVADLRGDDVILCQITSKGVNDNYSIPLIADDFKDGKLPVASNIRPNRLFTGESKIILKRAGKLKKAKIDKAIDKLFEIFKGE